MPDKVDFQLFTDGACSGNPGPGGWAYILRDSASGAEKKGSGAETLTTNNRMELISVIEGIRGIEAPTAKVEVVTDSNYVAKGITEWMAGWKARGWQRKEGNKLKPVMNVDLWQALDELQKNYRIRCQWVRGHVGHPENEECDRMAVSAYRRLMDGQAPEPTTVSAPPLKPVAGKSLFDEPPEFDRVMADASVQDGKPTIRGTRVGVDMILDSLAAGARFDDLVREHPPLAIADIQQALAYAAALVRRQGKH